MTAALEGGEWSAARPGRTLPPGKTWYPFCRRLGGPQGRSGRAKNLVPTGIRSRAVQPVVSRYNDWATGPTFSFAVLHYSPFLVNFVYNLTRLKQGHWNYRGCISSSPVSVRPLLGGYRNNATTAPHNFHSKLWFPKPPYYSMLHNVTVTTAPINTQTMNKFVEKSCWL